MDDVKRIEKDLLAELKARGVTVTDLKRRQIREVASDMVLVERLRDQINNGAALDIDTFMKLKASATASKAELFDGLAPHNAVSKIEVELVPAPAQYTALKDENAALRLQLAAYQSGRNSSSPNGSETGAAVPPSAPDATPPPAAPSAPPSNIVPFAETREQRIARLRYEAGDRSQPSRGPFDDGYGGDFGLSSGATRFDNKVPLP
jgi:hypothetical protein